MLSSRVCRFGLLARSVLRLLGGSFWIVGRIDEFLSRALSVVVVAAALQGFVVFGDGASALALGIVSISAFDVRPGIDPFGLTTGRIERRLKIVQRQLPVFLLEVDQSQIVVNPGVVPIEFQRRLQLLLSFGILTLVEQLDTAACDDRNSQVVRYPQDLVVRIDFSTDGLPFGFKIKIFTLSFEIKNFRL